MSAALTFHSVFVAQEVLQEHLDGVGQPVDTERRERVGAQRVVGEFTALNVERHLGAE